MKKLFLVLLIPFTLFASDRDLATRIYLSIAKGITSKSTPRFFLHGKIKHLDNNSVIHRSLSCEKADIVILNTLENLPKNCAGKPLFTTRYRTFKENEKILGVFFWQEHRPAIIFHRKALEEKGIHLNASFNKYIE